MSGAHIRVQTQKIIVNPSTNKSAVTLAGPQGPAGPPGVDGAMVGEIRMWPGASIPPTWGDCDFAEYSRTVYSDLFAVIGTLWGDGDGVTTFNVPDLRGRGPVGAGSGPGLTPRAVGDYIGEEEVLLSAEQSGLQPHNHTVDPPNTTLSLTDPGHNHTQNAHTHIQNAHTHVQNAHNHNMGYDGTLGGAFKNIASDYAGGGGGSVGVATLVGGVSSASNYLYAKDVTATNQNTTPTNQNTTATNIANTTGISGSVNIASFNSGTNTFASAIEEHNNIQPSAVVRFIIKLM